jgi:hypothetical protein
MAPSAVAGPAHTHAGEEARAGQAAGPPPALVVEPPPHPASYLEVLEMLEKGQTPPGIRVSWQRPAPLQAASATMRAGGPRVLARA